VSTDQRHPRSHLVRLTPMLAYTLVYAVTCLIGAFLLLVDWRSFVALFEYFSGTETPQLNASELATTLVLLVLAPVAMWAGFLGVTYVRLRPLDRAVSRIAQSRLDAPAAVPLAAFAVSLAAALVSLAYAGSFSRADAWLHYAEWITARQTVFARVGFAEFVNIYLLLPLSAAWVAVTLRPRGRGLLVIGITATLAVAVQLLLFQKKAALVAALVVLTALAVHVLGPGMARRARWAVPASVLGIAAVYFALVVLPVYAQTRQTVQTVVAPEGESPSVRVPISPQERTRRKELAEELGLDNRPRALVLYSLLSPLTRTSAAGLYYADVFPRRHPFYGFGLGDGKPTDDTRVVWNYMNPTLPGGTVAAPFQFGMFALWALVGALAACAAAGAGLALLWRIAVDTWPARDWQSLAGSLVVLLSVYLAIDSAQNSILVSYGVIWGFLFIAAAMGIAAAVRRAQRALRASKSSAQAGEQSRRSPRT
jgi:MFS family permease